MARQNNIVDYKSFVKGLVTEASALTFPDNASIDEVNFVLDQNGSRRRRLGMRYEENYETHIHSAVPNASGDLDITTYLWADAAKDFSREVAVIHVGSQIRFYDMSVTPLSSGLITLYTNFSDESGEFIERLNNVSFTSVDGILLMTDGSRLLRKFSYESGVVSYEGDLALKVRDFFGVEDIFDGKDLRGSDYSSLRPNLLSPEHIYNLRNQGWANPWRSFQDGSELNFDPLRAWEEDLGTWPATGTNPAELWPANSDNINTALYANTEDSDDRVGDRFFAKALIESPGGILDSARGHYIIDLFQRGTSRLENIAISTEKNYQVGYWPRHQVTSLPSDYNTKGATCVESYAGRAWYSGFDNSSVDGDAFTPSLNSYVLFSQLVKSQADLGKCYQAADPTSHIDSDLVDTDGGYLRVDGADQIIQLITVGRSLLVFANNGVWSIDGGSDYGFSATNYQVTRVCDFGVVGRDTIVRVEGSVLFWAYNGIYAVELSANGWGANNLSINTIQALFQEIGSEDKVSCKGFYDSYSREVRWLYGNRLSGTGNPTELVLNVSLGAFSKFEIERPAGTAVMPLSLFETSPYGVGISEAPVTVGGVQVTANGEDVYVSEDFGFSTTREVLYLTCSGVEDGVFGDYQEVNLVSTTFATYREGTFYDWIDYDGTGIDSQAYLVTGYLTGPDIQRFKQAPYVQFHFTRTEDGFESDGSGDFIPTNQSSCLVQPMWDWTNSANSNMWGKQFQAYRYKRMYFPEDINDSFDTGHETIITKNKLRGRGRVLSMKLETEPGKDCRILGWGMIVGSNGNV